MQGFNMGRYVPPEHEGTTSANKLAGKHALGSRARKAGQGILTVRFEMPFPIWCTTCLKPTIIGQGVRFNAEKKKIGNYYTTPIYSFRMKHVTCGGWIEIRTDPKNTAYVVTEGAKKRDTGEEKMQEGDIRIRSNEDRERLANDAFAALEGKVEDKRQATTDNSRIEELQRAKERDWSDPGEANRKLRKAFRVERKARQKNEGLTDELKDRMSLGIDLLEETEEDGRKAGFVDFGEFDNELAIVKAKSRPLFAESSTSKVPLAKRLKMTKSAANTQGKREKLRKELANNTRAAMDPFLKTETPNPISTSKVSFIKRKRSPTRDLQAASDTSGVKIEPKAQMTLVGYDSE